MSGRGQQIRQDVLSVLRRFDSPMSAYGVIGELRGLYPKIAPPTVYRALAALIKQGHIHRIESMNAYLACGREAHKKSAVISICNDCGAVEENLAPMILEQLSRLLSQSGFAPSRHVIEVHGVCSSCDGAKVST